MDTTQHYVYGLITSISSKGKNLFITMLNHDPGPQCWDIEPTLTADKSFCKRLLKYFGRQDYIRAYFDDSKKVTRLELRYSRKRVNQSKEDLNEFMKKMDMGNYPTPPEHAPMDDIEPMKIPVVKRGVFKFAKPTKKEFVPIDEEDITQ